MTKSSIVSSTLARKRSKRKTRTGWCTFFSPSTHRKWRSSTRPLHRTSLLLIRQTIATPFCGTPPATSTCWSTRLLVGHSPALNSKSPNTNQLEKLLLFFPLSLCRLWRGSPQRPTERICSCFTGDTRRVCIQRFSLSVGVDDVDESTPSRSRRRLKLLERRCSTIALLVWSEMWTFLRRWDRISIGYRWRRFRSISRTKISLVI